MGAVAAMVRLLAAAAIAAILESSAAGAPAGAENRRPVMGDCRESVTRDDRLEAVASRGELVLASGERILLSGLRLPEDGPLAEEASAWLRRRRHAIVVFTQRGDVDRWGRARVDAIAGEDEPEDLAVGLLAAGLAFVDTGESDALCRTDLLAAEAKARAARLGVWAGQPLSALDGAAFTSRAGRFTVAEGRVRSVGERRNRAFLDFVGPGEPGLSVTVTKRTWRIMLERGLTAESLKGRAVRVRGTVEMWRGPMLDIASPDMIEMLDGERALRR